MTQYNHDCLYLLCADGQDSFHIASWYCFGVVDFQMEEILLQTYVMKRESVMSTLHLQELHFMT